MPNVARRKRYPRKRYDELTVRWSNAPPCSIALTLFPLPSSNDDPRVDALLDNEQLAAVIGASPDYWKMPLADRVALASFIHTRQTRLTQTLIPPTSGAAP